MIHFPPKVILVPMDLLDPSFKALSQASLLAEAFGAQIEILHVLPAPAGSAPYYWDQTPDHKRRREAVAAIRRRLPTDAPIDVLEGDPVSAILHAAYLRRAGMIVMGSHGRSGWGRVLFGSTAEAVVRSSPVPVMVVRGVPGTIHSILAPLSFSPYALDAFRYAGKLAKTLDARLTALHAVSKGETPASVGRRMRSWVGSLPRGLKHACRARIIAEEPPAAVIARAASEHDAVVLAVHRHGALRDAILGTTAEQVLRRWPGLMIAVPPARLSSAAERASRLKLARAANK